MGPRPRDLTERFEDSLDFFAPVPEFAPHLGHCWVWTLGKANGGYGKIKVAGRTLIAHRVLWELVVGEVPEGMQLDHLCRVPACCNPDHLEVVTPSENKVRTPNLTSWYAERTHCKQGHEYTPQNTKMTSTGRKCRACQCANSKRWRDKGKVS